MGLDPFLAAGHCPVPVPWWRGRGAGELLAQAWRRAIRHPETCCVWALVSGLQAYFFYEMESGGLSG